MFWEIGKHISSVLLSGERVEYGKQIVGTLAQQLQEKYGSSFKYSNVTRMIKFAARFPDSQIVVMELDRVPENVAKCRRST